MEDKDRNRLVLYRRQFNELRTHKLLFDKNYILSHRIFTDKDLMVHSETKGFDVDVVKSFLITFRQFTMEKEDVFFYRICNIAYKWGMGNDRWDIKTCVADARECWGKIWKENDGLEIKLNETVLTRELFFDVLMNGWLVHSNKALSDLYHEIPDFAKMSLYASFQQALARLYACLHNVDMASDVVLDNPGRILKIQP